MKVLLDVDGVLADFASAYLKFCGYEGDLQESALCSWNSILEITQTTSQDIADAFACEGFCSDIPEYPWANDLVAGIEAAGHEVIFCTAVTGTDRVNWLAARWPKRKIVQTRHKELLAGDDVILVDDWEVNIDAFPGHKILFPRPWNMARGGSWQDVVAELREMSCLTIADALVSGSRNADYGHPYHDFRRVTGMINALFESKLREPFKASDWPLMMQCVKMSRDVNRPKLDNCVDGGGYWKTRQWTLEKERELEAAG